MVGWDSCGQGTGFSLCNTSHVPSLPRQLFDSPVIHLGSAELVPTGRWDRSCASTLVRNSSWFLSSSASSFPSTVRREGKSGHEMTGHAISPAVIQESL